MEMKLNIQVIKTEREKRAWTQQHLADVTDLSLRTIQRIESSGVGGAESIKAIAAAFNIEIDKLLIEEGKIEPSLGILKDLNPFRWFSTKTTLVSSLVFFLSISFFVFQTSIAIGDASVYRFEGGVRVDDNSIHEFGINVNSNQIFILDIDSNHRVIFETPEKNDANSQATVRLLQKDGHSYNVLHKSVRPEMDVYNYSLSYRVCESATIFYSPAVNEIPKCDADPMNVTREE